MYPPPSQSETANSSPNLKPPPPQMKLPIVSLIRNFSNVSTEQSEQWKLTEKKALKSSKNEMFIFGLHSAVKVQVGGDAGFSLCGGQWKLLSP